MAVNFIKYSCSYITFWDAYLGCLHLKGSQKSSENLNTLDYKNSSLTICVLFITVLKLSRRVIRFDQLNCSQNIPGWLANLCWHCDQNLLESFVVCNQQCPWALSPGSLLWFVRKSFCVLWIGF